MATILDKITAIANNAIIRASDRDLSDEHFCERILLTSKVKAPKLNLDQTQVKIEKESISYRNAPPGINFSLSGNNIIEYVLYKIPITGDLEIFANLAGRYINRQTVYVDSSTLYYKEYSNSIITGNEELINDIKGRVLQLAERIKIPLQEFEAEIEQFYQDELKPKIYAAIEVERNKRNSKSDSETKLNPFK